MGLWRKIKNGESGAGASRGLQTRRPACNPGGSPVRFRPLPSRTIFTGVNVWWVAFGQSSKVASSSATRFFISSRTARNLAMISSSVPVARAGSSRGQWMRLTVGGVRGQLS
ncbi:hypothetical protein SAMN02745219_02389 [Desulfofundulus thermosubterraneus DSM 16057]|uniref:Uncharacterized protein n=1 Tax=Desulfofundulus thermosubterraneus DSM 16057 TaxID=1121432 RepID=A0A1M6IPJ8_9FIRM|nr:hypothetical protein SAMN02745219_02389 [Desulfofundulus thermosubterraneus DSM 16057]